MDQHCLKIQGPEHAWALSSHPIRELAAVVKGEKSFFQGPEPQGLTAFSTMASPWGPVWPELIGVI